MKYLHCPFERLALCFLTILLVTPLVSAQTLTSQEISGTVTGGSLGWDVACLGDVNGDGVDDFIAGSPNEVEAGQLKGRARIYSGADNSVIRQFFSLDDTSIFGASVCGMGDVDGDGLEDVAVGAPLEGDAFAGTLFGTVRIYSTATGAVIHTIQGTLGTGGLFGWVVESMRDLDGDGIRELIVGAPSENPNGVKSGRARVFSGATGALIHTFEGASSNYELGASVASAGDVNADGFDDIIVGVHLDATNGIARGAAIVYSGLTGAQLYRFEGDDNIDNFGSAVTGFDDLNGDGYSDFAVGSPRDDNSAFDAGSVRFFSGFDGAVLTTIDGESSGDLFGTQVTSAGDVNNDGIEDILIGATRANGRGRVYLYSGIDFSLIDFVEGNDLNDRFGFSVSGGSDFDQDGIPDFVVGAPLDDNLGDASGSVRVLTWFTLPPASLIYQAPSGVTSLSLTWSPTLGDPEANTGTLRCTQATPGGSGAYVASLAPAFLLSPQNVPVLVALDPVNLADWGYFPFDTLGELVAPGVTRIYPFLAGNFLHFQFFEISPSLAASNGLALRVDA